MALIGTLRNKMTKWVVGFVAVAIGAFVLNDLFGNGPTAVFGNENTVGEIAGSSISLKEYQDAIQVRENNYIMNFGRQPGDREKPLLQQQAWEYLIAQKAIKPEFERLGVRVTSDEIWDMIQGKNVDEGVKNSFLDSAGNFDRAQLMQYIQQVEEIPTDPNLFSMWQQGNYRWTTFKNDLELGRERIKYENLLIKTNYVTKAEAERDYHSQNDVAEVKYVYVPFFAISDSAITVSDADLRAYYNRTKSKYKAEQMRSLNYVAFPIVASAEDSLQLREDLKTLAEGFKTTPDDSLYASTNTEGNEPFAKYNVSNLPPTLADQKDNLVVGTVFGPILEGDSYKVIKIVKIGRDTVGTAKASHILIRWDDESEAAKKAAKEKARKILAEIKGGASFAAKAREHGTDGTASQGGDLGWFSSGGMVKPFEDAVFGAKKTGVLSDVVETQFGYHLIDVTGVVDYTSYSVATIEFSITPSEETQNAAFLKAQNFAADLSGVKEFAERAKAQNLVVNQANNIRTNDRRLNDLGDARQIITWLFRDGKVGKVSEVQELPSDYIVAVMTSETNEGVRSFEAVKEEITPAVRNELKGKKIIETLKTKTGTLEELASAFGTDATVASSSDLKFNSNTLPSVGLDPVAVGKIFALENGKRSEPFVGENGVLVAELQNKTVAPALGDYSMFKTQLKQSLDGRSSMGIAEAIKTAAGIEDKRYKFF
ncbi:MAG: parvulin-like peptidyl-prolyl isomerase [Bacteroidetes bacterium OLB12]|nr:MAG: parvulin-like peptidyl-prolyl isomerase [Bacteroidetes bacterium OLB12]HNR73342.1 SurA N-terminal domain-containing protein [Cyclobacteriaceae bacterium]HNU42561.1 SurA N-terminal domain-containing protein [Cyclobacteriaceae bacterium]